MTPAQLAKREPDTHFPGRHPEYGGLNWGVQFSSHWSDYNVNHGLSGSHDTEPPRRFDGQEIPEDLPLWSCDQPTAALADTVWAAREQINAALRQRAIGTGDCTPAPLTGLAAMIFPTWKRFGIRIAVTVTDTTFTIRPYDNPKDFEPFTIERTT